RVAAGFCAQRTGVWRLKTGVARAKRRGLAAMKKITGNFDPARAFEMEDPLPAPLELQANDPIHWVPRHGAWLITRYDDVKAGLGDPRLSPKRVLPDPKKVDPQFVQMFADYKKYLDLWVVVRDPPDHTRLRGLVNKAFTPTAIEGLRPHITKIVE